MAKLVRHLRGKTRNPQPEPSPYDTEFGKLQDHRPGVPALDLWWLESRALMAKAERNWPAYAELARQYLEECEKLGARGRLAQAHRLVNEATAEIGVV